MSKSIRGHGGHLVFPIGPKNTNFIENVGVEFCSEVSEEKSKMSQQFRGQCGHLVFRIRLKNTILVKEIEILLPVKFR